MEFIKTVYLCGVGWLAVSLLTALFLGQVAKLKQNAEEWAAEDILRREG